MADDRTPEEATPEEPAAAEEPTAEEPAASEQPAAEQPAAAEQPPPTAEADELVGVAEVVASDDVPGREIALEAVEVEPGVLASAGEVEEVVEVVEAPRERPAIPGADLEVDIVVEGSDPLARGAGEELEEGEEPTPSEESDDTAKDQPIVAVTIDLAAGARYRATGKRKTAVARVTLKPGTGAYTINGRELALFFPRDTLQRNIRQPLEAVGYHERMDVVARLHGGGVASQAGALRHGISRALLDAEPNLRGELKRRGFLTRDSRVKERKKAGLKKARKRPQFSKR